MKELVFTEIKHGSRLELCPTHRAEAAAWDLLTKAEQDAAMKAAWAILCRVWPW